MGNKEKGDTEILPMKYMCLSQQESQNGLGWKGASRSSSSNHLAMQRDTFHKTGLLQVPPNLAFNTGMSTASLDNQRSK